jgi:cytochrome b
LKRDSATQVVVWDRVVRVVHWSLVIAVPIAYVTHGGLLAVHRAVGYWIAGLVVLRLVWGFVGTRHARFADFVSGPRDLARYLGQLARWREPRYLGHNPAGGAMIVVLLALLIAVSVTGLVIDTPSYRDDRSLQAVHELTADALIACVVVHVVGVLYASLRHRENLIGAMFSGKKRPEDSTS